MEAHIFFGSTEVQRPCTNETKSPYSGEVVSRYPECTAEDAHTALKIADKARKAMRTSTLARRIKWLEDVARAVDENIEELAQIITDEVGKTIHFSRIEAQRCAETIRLSIHAAVELGGETFNSDAMPSGRKSLSFYQRVPAGVVAAITPFNFPLNLIIHKVAPALAAGNSIVLKPAPEAPRIAYRLIKYFVDSPYAIEDAISLIYGDAEVGTALVQSPIPRVISFTGSAAVGKRIMRNAGIKKVALELGGNAATYIDKSVDLVDAARKCAMGSFYNAGQACVSLQRIYVHKDVYDSFTQLLVTETTKLKVGDPNDPDTFMGPLINKETAERAENWVKSAVDEGAKILFGGNREGLYFYPTIMSSVTDSMNIICEEVFAPIVSLMNVGSFDEALSQINNSQYGLQYSIFANDLSLVRRAIDDFECGGVVVNDIPTFRYLQPYGGTKQSGIGKEGPRYALEEFTEIKSVVIF
ncbi:MAG: aldehyde dehydrogenase family protein [Desulfobulbaceae bacterium]|uniref:Aldehyde dehydrogenase family protein n=1 Tax=Candidatus Desulfobia pelagia TaxID=2841692 RepID=A0A8J6NBT1_9BACT|nr:aldehyde dehydrogenase family protein [Candidatus Desulfobia pelagia]